MTIAEQFPLFNEEGEPADSWPLLSEQARIAVVLATVAAIREEGETLSIADLAELAQVPERAVRQLEALALAKAHRVLTATEPKPRPNPRLNNYAHFLVKRAEQGAKNKHGHTKNL